MIIQTLLRPRDFFYPKICWPHMCATGRPMACWHVPKSCAVAGHSTHPQFGSGAPRQQGKPPPSGRILWIEFELFASHRHMHIPSCGSHIQPSESVSNTDLRNTCILLVGMVLVSVPDAHVNPNCSPTSRAIIKLTRELTPAIHTSPSTWYGSNAQASTFDSL